MSVRVHQLAKELGLSSKALVEKLQALKVDVKGHMSALDDETAEIVRHELTASAPTVAAPAQAPARATAPRPTPPLAAAPPGLRPDRAGGASATATLPPEPSAPAPSQKSIQVKIPITVKDLSIRFGVKPSELLKQLMGMRFVAHINQALDEEVVRKLGTALGFAVERAPTMEEALLEADPTARPGQLELRSPVVTLMGHVDHGKTSLLDAIRQSRMAAREKGGITQHIGAYEATVGNRSVTFLDTPGHEAFTAMRARGAHATDVVVLVVAADDGVMPQTLEAIDHARAANVPIVVAMNKCDLPAANPDRVKQQLAQLGLTPEDWGGKAIFVPVSAKTGKGIDQLLEMLLLEAEILELKADPSRPAKGVVIEGRLSKGGGPTATVLVQNGTLRTGDIVVTGLHYGRLRAMVNDRGERLPESPPGRPVEILGLSGVPEAGDLFHVVQDEKQAKEIVAAREHEKAQAELAPRRHLTLDNLQQQLAAREQKELRLILKADVQGSLEALRDSLVKLGAGDVKLKMLHEGVGGITESDIMLAAASDAIVLGFHVGQSAEAAKLAEREGVDVHLYGIIYEAISAVRQALEGLLEPELKITVMGHAEVRQLFQISKVGMVAGCVVTDGRLHRADHARVIRDTAILFEGKIGSLKRFKEDVREVQKGVECGIMFAGGFNDIQVGDVIEAFQVEKIARKLEG